MDEEEEGGPHSNISERKKNLKGLESRDSSTPPSTAPQKMRRDVT